MPNLENEISNLTHKTLKNSNDVFDDDRKLFNCRIKSNCSVNAKGVIKKAKVSYKDKENIYIGSTVGEF